MKKAFTLAEAAQADLFNLLRKTCSAFTLAEVLVTLGIIGVVAAMTLPTIIDNSRNKQLESALKKSYSTLSQALDMYYAEEEVKLTPKNCGTRQLKPILMKYLNTAKDCGWGTEKSSKVCLPNPSTMTEEEAKRAYQQYKTLNGLGNLQMGLFDDGQFVLNDSSLVILENENINLPIYISVDVNGYNKRPNKLGIDLFMFQINDEGTLLPMGVKGTRYYGANYYCSWTSNSNMNGAGCTYKALYEKDYFKNLPR